jgi:hypothetical protein
MQPPPVEDRETSPGWVKRWTLRQKPDVLRFDAINTHGSVAPPVIVNATAP